MADKIEVLISKEAVDKRISELAEQISKDYEGKEVHMIGVLKGAAFFMSALAQKLTVPVSLDYMCVSSYGSSTKSSGIVKIVKDLDEPLMGKDVLIAEDIDLSGTGAPPVSGSAHCSTSRSAESSKWMLTISALIFRINL